MKSKLILLFGLLLALHVNLQAQTVKIAYPGYTSYWNSTTKIPDSVVYIETPHKKLVGREATFHADRGIPNLSKDYTHSGYDIGHLCNASDENGSKIDEYNSFSYANVFPQRPNDNRLTWLALENYIRKITTPVKVKIYWAGTNGTIGPDQITIPKYCIKEIWHNGNHEKYVIPNNDTCSKHLFSYYLVKP